MAPPRPSTGEIAHRDPRLDRSRAAILDAARELLAEGGIDRVTVEAITARSGVARSTLYRHFPTSTEVLAAAFQRLLPPLATPSPDGPLRERLLTLVRQQAAQIDSTPTMAAVIWMSASGMPVDLRRNAGEQPQLRTLRQLVIDRYREPFDPLLRESLSGGADADTLAIDLAAAQLIGPLVFNALITRRPNDESFCARLVDDFLANHG
jgi:TetR/AcrR family transcriptional regulator of autoinduction and epiphytic fitness